MTDLTFEMSFSQKPWSHDVRSNDYTSDRFYGAIEVLKPTLNRPRTDCFNQGETQECAPHAAAKNGQLLYGFLPSIPWQVDKISRIQGKSVDLSGSDPNAAMDSQMYEKVGGYLPQLSWHPENPQACDVEAQDYGCEAYIKPSSGKDVFDSICMEIQRHYDSSTTLGAAVQMFTAWYDSFGGTEVTQLGRLLGYHSYLAIDFDRTNPDETKHFLIIQNSYGEEIGDKGFQHFYRPLVNQLLSQWGSSCKIVSPLTADQRKLAKEQSQYGILERLIINAWYKLTLYLVQLYGRFAR